MSMSNMIKEIEKKRKSLDDERSRILKGVLTDVEGQINGSRKNQNPHHAIYQVVL